VEHKAPTPEEAAIVADLHARRDALRAALDEKEAVVRNFGKLWILAACTASLPLSWVLGHPFGIVINILIVISLLLPLRLKAKDIILLIIPFIWLLLLWIMIGLFFEAFSSAFSDATEIKTPFVVFLFDAAIVAVPQYLLFLVIILGPLMALVVRTYFPSSRIAFFYGIITSILFIAVYFIFIIMYMDYVHLQLRYWNWSESVSFLIVFSPGLLVSFWLMTRWIHPYPGYRADKRIKKFIIAWIIWALLTGHVIIIIEKGAALLLFVLICAYVTMAVIAGLAGTRIFLRIALARWRKKVNEELTRLDIELA
jgi:hypothetical protein